MKRFSVLAVHIGAVLICIVLPCLVIFFTYANRIVQCAMDESEKIVQNNMEYVSNAFEMLADATRFEAVRISASEDYITAVNKLTAYDEIIQDTDLREDIGDVVSRLATVQFVDERLRNVYLFTPGSDYLLTSDRGILRISALNDFEWLEQYQRALAEKGLSWICMWTMRVVPETDLLRNGSWDGETPVISYIYSVRMPNTGRLCLLVMNYYETAISDMINASANGEVYIVDRDGMVICHPDKARLGQNLLSEEDGCPSLAELQARSYAQGDNYGLPHLLSEKDRTLYTYRETGVGEWAIVSATTIEVFSNVTVRETGKSMIALLFVLILGCLAYSWVTRRILQPIRRLSGQIPNQADGKTRNEILLLESGVRDMWRHQRELSDRLNISRGSTNQLYILALLRDIPWLREVPVAWRHTGFCAVLVSLDDAAQLTRDLAREECFRLLQYLTTAAQSLPHDEAIIMSAEINAASQVFLINAPLDHAEKYLSQITENLTRLKAIIREEYPVTFTAGVGTWEDAPEKLFVSYRHAQKAVRQKLWRGKDHVIVYDPAMDEAHPCEYPVQLEAQALSAILNGDAGKACDGVNAIVDELTGRDADSSISTVNRLLSAMHACLSNSANALDPDEDLSNWLICVSGLETMEEMRQFLQDKARLMADTLGNRNNNQRHLANIERYIEQNYNTDINFEDMAAEIGICYSYMRRLVKCATEQSLLDMVHARRIRSASELLTSQKHLSVRQVSEAVGYNNIQSFNRFFRKFEGVSPTEYRALHF